MPYNDIEISLELKRVQNITANVGTVKDHNLLNNRDLDNQHPISAISGLTETINDLDNKKVDKEDITSNYYDKNQVYELISESQPKWLSMGDILNGSNNI